MTARLPLLVCWLVAASLILMPTSSGAQSATEATNNPAAAEEEQSDTVTVYEAAENNEAADEQADTKEIRTPPELESTRPTILGMTVVEGTSGRAKVINVGASTPAWDAGVRENDEVISLHGAKIEAFADWVERVRKIVSDAKEGQAVPLQVVRDSTPLDLQVKIPKKMADKIARETARQERQERAAVLNQSVPVPGVAGGVPNQPGAVPYPVGGGVGVAPFGFDEGVAGGVASDRVPMRAVAQLMGTTTIAAGGTAAGRVGRQPGLAAPVGGATGGTVGTAEFADVNSGMAVSLVVGGLPAGSYRVGIGDVGAVGGAAGGLANPAGINDGSFRTPRDGFDPAIDPRQRQRGGLPVPGPNPQPNPSPQPGPVPVEPHQPGTAQPAGAGGAGGATPGAGGATGGGAGAAGGSPQGGASVARSIRVLAQVTDGSDVQTGIPNQQSTNSPGVIPPRTGIPSGEAPNQIGQTPSQIGNPNRGAGAPQTATNGTGGLGSQPWIEIGVLNVRANGTAQLQQRIEGVRVQNVIGQSVMIVSERLQGPAGPGPALLGGAPTGADPRQATAAAQGGIGVVAAGVIQPVSTGAGVPQGAGSATGLGAPGIGAGVTNPATQQGQSGLTAPPSATAPAAPLDRNQ